MVLNALKGYSLPEGLNETFITLISKVEHPQLVTQFRPIGLCNVAYKVISKVIVQRLKSVLLDLVSSAQANFVPKR